MVSSFIEYGLLAINCAVTIKSILEEKRRTNSDQNYKIFREEKKRFLVHKKCVIDINKAEGIPGENE